MRSDAETRALALATPSPPRPWWKPTLPMAAILCLVIAFGVQSVQIQLGQHDLRAAIADTRALADENRRLAAVAAQTATHGCKVTRALVRWARRLGPLERTVSGNAAYHEARLAAFAELQATLYLEDGVPCTDAPPSFLIFPFPLGEDRLDPNQST